MAIPHDARLAHDEGSDAPTAMTTARSSRSIASGADSHRDSLPTRLGCRAPTSITSKRASATRPPLVSPAPSYARSRFTAPTAGGSPSRSRT